MESALREVWGVGSAVRRESRFRRHVRQIMVADLGPGGCRESREGIGM